MDGLKFEVFVQARMSSSRFPGKMLAPLAGRPVIDWLLERLGAVVGRERLVLATSDTRSDDPLAHHAGNMGYQVFRGSLDNVFLRFQQCLRTHPAEWVVRICGDSPLLDPGLIGVLLSHCRSDIDLVTNVAVRSYPPGQSVEVLNAASLLSIDALSLSGEEQEHPTQVFYRNPERFRIHNCVGADPEWPRLSYVVDTIEDLRRLYILAGAGKFPSFSPERGQ